MSYKEKTCPTCGKTHNKRGNFCSRSCGNHRTHSIAHKKLLSAKQTAHMNSYAAVEQVAQAKEQMKLERKKQDNRADEDLQALTVDDLYIPPITSTLGTNQFVSDGDIWTEID